MKEFAARRALALAILNANEGLSRRAGQFCGQVCVEPFSLTDKQGAWLRDLAAKAGLSDMLEDCDV